MCPSRSGGICRLVNLKETLSRIARHLAIHSHSSNFECSVLLPRHCFDAEKCPSPPDSISIVFLDLMTELRMSTIQFASNVTKLNG